MSKPIIKVENIGKQYRLGTVGTGTFSHDVNRWWHKVRGKEDPYLKIGEVNDRSVKGDSEYVWALKDINFEVQTGEILGIIGKNGAGKSTLLKILSRVTAPTTGKITCHGRIASLLEVGTGFHPELTGKENIYLNGAILGMTKKEIAIKFDEIVDFAGCAKYIDTPVKRYSSGMYVRLAFAVAAHLEPDILVVDEVLAVGDAEFQKKAIGKMKEVSQGQGRTVIFVSHNMGSIQSLCNRGIVLSNGSVQFEGEITEAIQQYNTINTDENGLIYYGEKIIKKIEILQIQSGLKSSIYSTINIRVNFSTVNSINNVILGFIIKDSTGVPLIGVNNKHYSNVRINNQAVSEGEVHISIEDITLIPGSYKMDFFLGDSTTDLEEVMDAVSFEINEYQINPTSLSLNASINKFFCKNINWKINHDKASN